MDAQTKGQFTKCEICEQPINTRGFRMHLNAHKRRGEDKPKTEVESNNAAVTVAIAMLLDNPTVLYDSLENRLNELRTQKIDIERQIDRLLKVLRIAGGHEQEQEHRVA